MTLYCSPDRRSIEEGEAREHREREANSEVIRIRRFAKPGARRDHQRQTTQARTA